MLHKMQRRVLIIDNSGVKSSRPDSTGVTVLPRGDIGGLRRALAILQGR